MTTERFTRNDNVRFCSGLSVVVGAASHAAWRGRQETDSAITHVPGFDQGWLGYGEGEDRATEGGMRCRLISEEGSQAAGRGRKRRNKACSPSVM